MFRYQKSFVYLPIRLSKNFQIWTLEAIDICKEMKGKKKKNTRRRKRELLTISKLHFINHWDNYKEILLVFYQSRRWAIKWSFFPPSLRKELLSINILEKNWKINYNLVRVTNVNTRPFLLPYEVGLRVGYLLQVDVGNFLKLNTGKYYKV